MRRDIVYLYDDATSLPARKAVEETLLGIAIQARRADIIVALDMCSTHQNPEGVT